MNVKKLLKKQKSAIMPSDSVKRRIAADCGVYEDVSVPAGGGAAVKVKRKAAVSVAACCAACCAAAACAIILIKPAAPSILPEVIETDFGTISSATEFYAYSAVSIGNMLEETDLTNVASAFALADGYDTSATISAEITELQKKTLDKYAVFATGMLGGGKITSSCTVADKEGYEYKLGIGYSDGFGSSADTVLYFNKVAGTVKVEDDEEEFEIKGELVKGNVSFPVKGKYETEVDDNETESEIWFRAYTSSTDENSYIQIGYEYDSETGKTKSELVVTVRENNIDIEKATIKGETGEDNSFEVDVERNSAEENVKIKFNPFEENGKKVMHVDAWFGEFGEHEHNLIMQSKPWEQGGGFDFINRGNANGNPNGNGSFYPPDHDDDWGDNENKDDKEDKDEKDEKDKPNPSPSFPNLEWGVEDFPSLN